MALTPLNEWPGSLGELCARTLPRVAPSLRPALAAGYQRLNSSFRDGFRWSLVDFGRFRSKNAWKRRFLCAATL